MPIITEDNTLLVIINKKQHTLITKVSINKCNKSALTISISLYFTMALTTLAFISVNQKI